MSDWSRMSTEQKQQIAQLILNGIRLVRDIWVDHSERPLIDRIVAFGDEIDRSGLFND